MIGRVRDGFKARYDHMVGRCGGLAAHSSAGSMHTWDPGMLSMNQEALLICSLDKTMFEDPLVKQISRDIQDLHVSDNLREMSKSTVLITGASGMLGTYFTIALALMQIESGSQPSVVAVSRSAVPLFDSLHIRNIHPVETKEFLRTHDIDVLIHAASPAHASIFMQDPYNCFELNVIWAESLARVCIETQTRFVYVSSGEIYGTNPPVPTRETDFGGLDPLIPRNIYAVSKRAGEAILSLLVQGQNLDLRICRLFHTFGPGIRSGEPRIFGALVNAALQERDCEVVGNAEATRSFLYSFDALNGIAFSIYSFASGTAVNVAGSRAYTIREMASQAMLTMTDDRHGVKFVQASEQFLKRESQIVRNEADNSLLRSTGWIPQVSLGDSFSRTLNSLT